MLYNHFNEYEFEIDESDIDKTFACCDPAKSGTDSLSMIIASTLKSQPNRIFIRDILFTNKHESNIAEIIALKLTEYKVTHFRIESNGVGAYLGDLIQKELDAIRNNFTIVKEFTQKRNKDHKIFNNHKLVERYMFYPILFHV